MTNPCSVTLKTSNAHALKIKMHLKHRPKIKNNGDYNKTFPTNPYLYGSGVRGWFTRKPYVLTVVDN